VLCHVRPACWEVGRPALPSESAVTVRASSPPRSLSLPFVLPFVFRFFVSDRKQLALSLTLSRQQSNRVNVRSAVLVGRVFI